MSNLKIKSGNREVAVPGHIKQRLASRNIETRVQYCERSLSVLFLIDPNDTVAQVRRFAKGEMEEAIKKNYGVAVEIDEELTDVLPKPASDSQRWRDLSKDTTIVFWPTGDPPNDSPLREYVKVKSTKENLNNAEEEKGINAENEPSSTPSDPAAAQGLSTEVNESKRNDYQKELDELRNRLKKLEIEHERELKKLQDTITSQTAELARVTNKWHTLLHRNLVNDVRAKVVEQMGCHSWSDIDRENQFQSVVQALTTLREKSPLKDRFESSVEDLASFLIDDIDQSWEQG